MTEKRFYIAESNLIEGYCVFDREKKYAFHPRPRKADCLNDALILNELNDENERLKKERNHFERKKTQYLTEWNNCRIKNTELRKDNLQAFALLGDIRALARTSDIETIIKKINKFEKEVVK